MVLKCNHRSWELEDIWFTISCNFGSGSGRHSLIFRMKNIQRKYINVKHLKQEHAIGRNCQCQNLRPFCLVGVGVDVSFCDLHQHALTLILQGFSSCFKVYNPLWRVSVRLSTFSWAQSRNWVGSAAWDLSPDPPELLLPPPQLEQGDLVFSDFPRWGFFTVLHPCFYFAQWMPLANSWISLQDVEFCRIEVLFSSGVSRCP